MERNIIGDLLILKQMNIKPNFSELARLYHMDRHTVSKYWHQGGIKKVERKPKGSVLDPYREEMERLFKKPGVHKRSVYQYLAAKYGQENLGTYSNFKYYTWKHGMMPQKTDKPHVRFETRPGAQLQVDWKENLRMTTSSGEVIEFSLMTSTLGYSREHIFVYAKSRTTEDFLRCLIETFQKLGGLPDHILTDNMPAVVSIANGSRRKHQKIKAFEKDSGVQIRLCRPRSPQTKGKDESANRFVSWLKAYDGEFESEEELIGLIEKINEQANNQINQTTSIPPHVLFQKEKEYLRPLPSQTMLDSYANQVILQKVPSTLLVTYKGSGYSVPAQFIHKRVRLVPVDDKLYIYFNTELITVHEISNHKFSYKKDHYLEALGWLDTNKEKSIEKMAEENLRMLERIEK